MSAARRGPSAAWSRLRRGVGDLDGQPVALGLALVGGALGGLAFGASRAAAQAVAMARGLDGAGAGAAVFLFFLGGAVGALAFPASVSAVLDGRRLRGALRRATQMVSLLAVERLLEAMLLLAVALPGMRALAFISVDSSAPPLRLSLLVLACAAPVLPILMIEVPAFAIAAARTAAGERNAEALAAGLSLALRHPGEVLGTGLLALVATAPLWATSLLASRALSGAHAPGLQVALAALSGAASVLSALVVYAALGRLGADLDAPADATQDTAR